jgi:cytochrome b561
MVKANRSTTPKDMHRSPRSTWRSTRNAMEPREKTSRYEKTAAKLIKVALLKMILCSDYI